MVCVIFHFLYFRKYAYKFFYRVHEFSWHGSDDSNKTTYSADKDQFKILNCAPGQFYYNVREVRTSDDALIRIKLMIFHELKDIKKLVKTLQIKKKLKKNSLTI
jgi:hypothetical protein